MKDKIYFLKSIQVINILLFLALLGLLLEHATHKTVEVPQKHENSKY